MLVVVATPKNSEEYWNSVPGRCLSTIANKNHNFKTKIVYNNTDGLPYVYNNVAGDLEEDIAFNYCFNDNICVFMHDDVEIHDLFFYEKLEKAHETYDIVGVAGATKQVYTKDKPSLWHMACDNFIWGTNGRPGDGRGFITTPSNGFLTQTFFGPTPAETSMIDGCFMSVNIKRAKEVGLKFDEDFDFHHYDLQLALDSIKLGLKIGVYPIYVIHHSPGLLSLQDEKFVKSDKKFKEKVL